MLNIFWSSTKHVRRVFDSLTLEQHIREQSQMLLDHIPVKVEEITFVFYLFHPQQTRLYLESLKSLLQAEEEQRAVAVLLES